MKSEPRGARTFGVDLTNVSPSGFWLLIDEREFFLAFDQFPWFAEASVRQLAQVERPSSHHLHWPALDVDLAVDSLEHPERYPLVSRVSPGKRQQPASLSVRRRRAKKQTRSSPASLTRG